MWQKYSHYIARSYIKCAVILKKTKQTRKIFSLSIFREIYRVPIWNNILWLIKFSYFLIYIKNNKKYHIIIERVTITLVTIFIIFTSLVLHIQTFKYNEILSCKIELNAWITFQIHRTVSIANVYAGSYKDGNISILYLI